jgi:hypothetical protein
VGRVGVQTWSSGSLDWKQNISTLRIAVTVPFRVAPGEPVSPSRPAR